jgi:hypothetical protein
VLLLALLLLLRLPGCQGVSTLHPEIEACVSQHAGWKQQCAGRGGWRLSGALLGLLLHGRQPAGPEVQQSAPAHSSRHQQRESDLAVVTQGPLDRLRQLPAVLQRAVLQRCRTRLHNMPMACQLNHCLQLQPTEATGSSYWLMCCINRYFCGSQGTDRSFHLAASGHGAASQTQSSPALLLPVTLFPTSLEIEQSLAVNSLICNQNGSQAETVQLNTRNGCAPV